MSESDLAIFVRIVPLDFLTPPSHPLAIVHSGGAVMLWSGKIENHGTSCIVCGLREPFWRKIL